MTCNLADRNNGSFVQAKHRFWPHFRGTCVYMIISPKQVPFMREIRIKHCQPYNFSDILIGGGGGETYMQYAQVSIILHIQSIVLICLCVRNWTELN